MFQLRVNKLWLFPNKQNNGCFQVAECHFQQSFIGAAVSTLGLNNVEIHHILANVAEMSPHQLTK